MFALRRSTSIALIFRRYRSTRRATQIPPIDQNSHITTETVPISLDSLSPVARQLLSSHPSYALRFGAQLSHDKTHLVKQQSRTTGRAENLLKEIPRDEVLPIVEDDDADVAQVPIVAFPSAENRFKIDLGNEDKNIPTSQTARCFGCGAFLQCRDRTAPGFMPMEVFTRSLSSRLQQRTSQCQRCFLLKYTEEISQCEVDEQVYKQILSEIRRKRALIILLVDLLDLPNSISRSWAHLVEETSTNQNASGSLIFVLGNKVDLLPRGSDSYLNTVRECLENECNKRGLGKHLVKYYGLISARTGYGIEELISKIFRYWPQHGGVYLLGGTNAGKSSLFNTLLDSDLCHIHALDCIQRATVSNLPGTTMNVLKFPIQLRTGKNQFMRVERLKQRKEEETKQQTEINSINNETTIVDGIEPTVKWRRRSESEINLPSGGTSYTYSSGQDSFDEVRSFESNKHNYVSYRQKKMRAFDPESYKNERWLYDTPGVILPEQMINKCSSQKEMSCFDHQSEVIRPVNILLEVGQTILIGGIARIDVKEMTDNARATLSLMISSRFPINIVPTSDVEQFYQEALENDQLEVPQNRIHGRPQDPPRLVGPTIEILGVGHEEAAGDIVLSSAGWASVQCARNAYVTFEVMTPDGLGIHLRQPALLKHLFQLRGAHLEQTPFFEKHADSKDRSVEEKDSEQHLNETELILNEQLWKGDQAQRRRRARRT